MGRYCVAANCNAVQVKGSDRSFHLFPKEPHIRQQWEKFVRHKRADFRHATDYSALCSDHFVDDCFVPFSKRKTHLASKNKLVPGAVPSIHKPAMPADQSQEQQTRSKAMIKLDAFKRLKSLQTTSHTGYDSTVPEPEDFSVQTMPAVSEVMDKGDDTADTFSSRNDATSIAVAMPEVMDRGDIADEFDATSITVAMPHSGMEDDGALASPFKDIKPSMHSVLTMKPIPPIMANGQYMSYTAGSRTVGTQKSYKAPPHRSSGTQTQGSKMVDCGTQTELTSCRSTGVQCELLCSASSQSSSSLNSSFSDVRDDRDVTYNFEEDLANATVDSCISEVEAPEVHQDAFEERKFIVCESRLLELFSSLCIECGQQLETSTKELGSCLEVNQLCKCGQATSWRSQPTVGQMPVGNLQMSAAILFNGCLPAQTLDFLQSMNVACINRRTFYRHQELYLYPTIQKQWIEEQALLLQKLRDDGQALQLCGDGRSDSPGHCAKYGGFNTIEARLQKVIDVQVVQSNEVPNSTWCEHEGLKRTLELLKQSRLSIRSIVTDRHKQNAAYLRKEHQEIAHYFDVWHVAKGLGKKLDALSQKKGNEIVQRWKKGIINHLYWIAASSDGNEDMQLAKWESLTNHIVDSHTGHSNIFPECAHGDLEGDEREWFDPESQVYHDLCKLVDNKYLAADVKKLSPQHQTSQLEAFHSLILKYAPKHTHFSYNGMKCRLYLAALHFNENSQREQSVNASGEKKFRVEYPKFKKGEPSVKPMKEPATFHFRETLMLNLFDTYANEPDVLRESATEMKSNVPPSLSSSKPRTVSVSDAVKQYQTRFKLH